MLLALSMLAMFNLNISCRKLTDSVVVSAQGLSSVGPGFNSEAVQCQFFLNISCNGWARPALVVLAVRWSYLNRFAGTSQVVISLSTSLW